MVAPSYWWRRQRLAITFAGLALALGAVIGALAEAIVLLPPPPGSRPTFYLELFFAAIFGVAMLLLLVARSDVGLPLLLAVLAFLPSRTGMQFKIYDPIVVTVADLVAVLGFVMLIVRAKILRRERLRPLAVALPLWIWVVVGLVGMVVAAARGVPWANVVAEIKGYYLPILITILCVNLIRTREALRLTLAVIVVSALPDVLFQYRDASAGNADVQVTLANGVTFARTAGGAGTLNQYAFYLMIVFFLAIGLGMGARWPIARLFFFACAAAFSAGIILTYTRGAWVATGLGLAVLGIAGGRRVLVGLATSGTVASYFFIPPSVWQRLDFSDHSAQERLEFARVAAAAIRANPLLGGGWGSNYFLLGDKLIPSFVPADLPLWHDDYLIVATQVGLPGLAVFLWVLGTLAWATARAYLRSPAGPAGPSRPYLLAILAAFVAMCTQALTDMFFSRPQIIPMVWLVIGLMCAAINIAGDERAGARGHMVTPR